MSPDGIRYLDIMDAYLNKDWSAALNAFASPAYSWLLGFFCRIIQPTPYSESTTLHFVNFVMYCLALCSFHLLLTDLFRLAKYIDPGQTVMLAKWQLWSISYLLFIWASLILYSPVGATPDIGLIAAVCLTCTILVRIRLGIQGPPMFFLIGALIGLDYLLKAVMLPVGVAFLITSLLITDNRAQHVRRLAMATCGFALTALPFIAALSYQQGRPTAGETAKLSYAWFIDGFPDGPSFWEGKASGSGTPRHPARIIFDSPRVYEFSSPIAGTYPLAYDPSYWNDGIRAPFILQRQLSMSALYLYRSVRGLWSVSSILIVWVSAFYLFQNTQCKMRLSDLLRTYFLMFPAVFAVVLYVLVYVELRYLAPFVLPLYLPCFFNMRVPKSNESARKLLWSAGVAVVVTLALTLALQLGTGGVRVLRQMTSDIIRGPRLPNRHYEIAKQLEKLGVQPGAKVGLIGYIPYYWARLAKLRIAAELPPEQLELYWRSDSKVKKAIDMKLYQAGVTILVSANIPEFWRGSEWTEIGLSEELTEDLDHYVYYAHGLIVTPKD